MPKPSEIRAQQQAVEKLLGLHDPVWVPLADASTSVVCRLPEHGMVVRFAGAGTQPKVLAEQTRRASALVAAGVPFGAPVHLEPLVCAGGLATVWYDLGTTGPVNYAHLGETLRSLHTNGTDVLMPDATLRDVDDVAWMTTRLEAARAAGRLAGAEYEALRPWPDRVASWLLNATPHVTGRVLVHDDVWPKNIIQTGEHAYLIDPDNLAWGTSDHDLGFISRAHEAGTVSARQVAVFEEAYGATVPDIDTAWVHAYVHRLRWVLNLVERRHLVAADERALRIEVPLWLLPRGPRDEHLLTG